MLRFERRFTTALLGSAGGGSGDDVTDFVDGTLRAMPEHLRLGVAAESVLLAAWSAVRYRGRPPEAAAVDLQRSLTASPVGLLRQYVRLFRSLVLFAEQELGAGGT